MKKNIKVVELRGVEFVNKGAELMLYAILEQVKKKFPDTIFVMEHTHRAPRKKQLEHGIYTKTNIKKYRLNMEPILNLLPKGIRRKFFFISENEIDVVLDGSGFAFGDFWGSNKAGARFANHVESWKKRGVKMVLLPQALGPFTDSALIRKMKNIVRNSNLIFARDPYSFNYIKALDDANLGNIDLKPDFTNLVYASKPDSFDNEAYNVAIIPNSKLIESKVMTREQYVEVLNILVDKVQERNLNPFFLVHEGGGRDLLLVQEVNTLYQKNIKIIKEDNPISVKGIIGSCRGVVTSRFHGLVSALSQATPCLCIGWSHKYEALMEDYDYKEGLIKIEGLNEKIVSEKLGLITDKDTSEEIIDKLRNASEKQKELSREMWRKVFNLMED